MSTGLKIKIAFDLLLSDGNKRSRCNEYLNRLQNGSASVV